MEPSVAEGGETVTRVREAPLGGEDGGATELARGASIGRYVVLDKLGAGAMGVVYCAFDPELDRKVAIKLLRPEASGSTLSESQAARARLLREAQALAKLGHPNVVAVHDVGTHGDDVWIAMEFVKGQTLTRWRQQHRGGWREVLEVMTRAGQGLAAAHAAGLIHRDVKPDNVMVGDDGRVRMM
ncbi:MAG: serine/threonine protein kinase, partial [Myxococcales bacterium]|nr:serine/threonine protein kinase [Myxococcales bacterium]